jgi:hypothetical protein
VGVERTYQPENEEQIEQERLSFLRMRRSLSVGTECKSVDCEKHEANQSAALGGEFQPRSAVEKPRNAVCVDHSIKDLITCKVLDCVLTAAVNPISTIDGRKWNKGGWLLSRIY